MSTQVCGQKKIVTIAAPSAACMQMSKVLRLDAHETRVDLLCRAQKLRHQDIPELTAKVENLDAEATQHLQASMAAQDDHGAAQEAQQVPFQRCLHCPKF